MSSKRKRAKREAARANEGLNRRDFLKRTAKWSAAAMAFPYFVPGSALGKGGSVAAGSRIAMCCIGVGGQGTSNLEGFLSIPEMQFVAVCDVDRAHRAKATSMIEAKSGAKGVAEYNDFREMLARTDLDGVSIAVPDHWHSIPAIAAADRKLDIYGEKPIARTIYEGRKMCEAVGRNGIVWQTGSWQRSQEHFLHAAELVRNGRIGKIHTVRVGLPTGSPIGPQPEMPVPDGFDYDMWLGPAPWKPYTEKRCHWNFRWILDYSGGQLTDWAGHHIDIANWGMGTEYTGPYEVEPVSSSYPREGLYDAPTTYHFIAKFGPGVSPVAPDGFVMHVANDKEIPMGARFEGEGGWIHVDRGNRLESEPGNLKDSVIGEHETRLYHSRNHGRNFLECVYSRQKTICPIEVGQRAISVAHLGSIAMELGRKVQWDPVNEQFINDPQASRYLKRAMRGEWRV